MCRNETRLLPKRHVLTLRKYTLIECLAQDVLNENLPSICILLTFAPNSADFVSLPLTIGRI